MVKLAKPLTDAQEILEALKVRSQDDSICEVTLAKHGLKKRFPMAPDTAVGVHIKAAGAIVPVEAYIRAYPASHIARHWEEITKAADIANPNWREEGK
jgi:hypothetical protein